MPDQYGIGGYGVGGYGAADGDAIVINAGTAGSESDIDIIRNISSNFTKYAGSVAPTPELEESTGSTAVITPHSGASAGVSLKVSRVLTFSPVAGSVAGVGISRGTELYCESVSGTVTDKSSVSADGTFPVVSGASVRLSSGIETTSAVDGTFTFLLVPSTVTYIECELLGYVIQTIPIEITETTPMTGLDFAINKLRAYGR